MALAHGAVQEILPPEMRAYHIDHDSKWRKPDSWFRRVARRHFLRHESVLTGAVVDMYWWLHRRDRPRSAYGVPIYSGYQYRKLVDDMLKGKRPFVFNGALWGLRDEPLDEFVIISAKYQHERST
jgi:hypothetical protein